MTADKWKQWQDSPWGRLRYATASANLARHLDDDAESLRILDLGGGDGSDSLPFAASGHHVTIVDSDPAMLERASARGVESNSVRLVQADLAADWRAAVDGTFDVVLVHNVIQYLGQPFGVLAQAIEACAPGGIVSVIAINRHSAPVHEAVRRSDPVAAAAMLDADRMRAVTFDTDVTLFAAEDVAERLRELGSNDIAHYGIRTFSDFITDDEKKYDPEYFDALMRLELAATDRWPYKHTARLFQLITRM